MAPFHEIYEENVWRVYGFIAYRVGSREDAEDLTSQTFERALRAWHRYDERRAPPGAWLIAITRNLVIDHFRAAPARGAHAPLHDAPDSVLPSSAGPEHDVGIAPELAAALTRLGDREREIVALRFGADLTGRQIADLTGMTLANAQQILSRTLRRLRAELPDQVLRPGRQPDHGCGQLHRDQLSRRHQGPRVLHAPVARRDLLGSRRRAVPEARNEISSRNVRVRADCTYRSRVTFRTRLRLRRGTFIVRARFQGNTVLAPRISANRTVRAG